MNWAVFLDRDGVINEEVTYLSDPESLRLIPGAAVAISMLNRQAIPVIVVTNQAGVARGYYPESQVAILHQGLADRLAVEDARIDRFYYCPHHPTEGLPPYRILCECRKPNPGMLLQAARDFDLDLSRCTLIGDKASDLVAGWRAGCQTILVETGYGKQEWLRWSEEFQPQHIACDVLEAVEWIVSRGV